MHLNGWIGLGKAREKHVLNLAGGQTKARRESKT
jgi:hypothetical protein